MNLQTATRYSIVFFIATLLLLSACQPAAINPTPQPTQIPLQPTQTLAQPTATAALQPTPTPVQPTRPPLFTSGGISLDLMGLCQKVTVESVAAVPASAGGPYWEGTPPYRLLTFQDYPVANHHWKPQIFIYAVADLAPANENMGKIAVDLKTLLQTKQADSQIPFLPLSNLAQLVRVQLQFMDSKSSQGVSFVTQLDGGLMPVNNYKLIYAYQGLTSDGKYYIAAILPVTHPELPDSSAQAEQHATVPDDFPNYISKIVTSLNQAPAARFTPDLNKLDAMIRSLVIK